LVTGFPEAVTRTRIIASIETIYLYLFISLHT
jgi:hypothetical protein